MVAVNQWWQCYSIWDEQQRAEWRVHHNNPDNSDSERGVLVVDLLFRWDKLVYQ
jgi:hypothetical protein